MARSYPSVRRALHEKIQDNEQLDRDNELAVWKRLFVQCIFEVPLEKPSFWILDALDESSGHYSITHLLTKVSGRCPVKIFMTTRPSVESQRDLMHPQKLGIVEEISINDTAKDIELYLAAEMEKVPLVSQEGRQTAVDTILARCEGCFLWVVLVLKELERVFSEEGVQQVLNEVPQGMNSLYKRALDSLSQLTHGKHILKALLIWAVCGTRPLKITELDQALKIDVGETIALERLIRTSCGQLLHLDRSGHVMLIHQTAREFLMGEDLMSEFAFSRAEGHGRLADVCLKYLNGEELKAPRNPKLMQIARAKAAQRSPFADYACCFFSEHLRRSPSTEDSRLLALDGFLKTNVLSWIEHLARLEKLHYLINAARDLQGYLGARAKHQPLMGKEIQRINTWSLDLVRLAVQFGKSLLDVPSAIYWLIPPFCPSSSALGPYAKATKIGISIVGVSNTAWSDRLHCINYHNRYATSLAFAGTKFAVGLTNGTIQLYYRTTCHKARQFAETEGTRLLTFSDSGKLLAISGLHALSVWDTESGERLWRTAIRSECLIMKFVDRDTTLRVFSKSGSILSISVKDRSVLSSVALQITDDESALFRRTYTTASLSMDLNLIAVVQRGRPVDLYIMEDGSYMGCCGREPEEDLEMPGSALLPIREVLFHPIEEVCRLVALYQDGELALLDPVELSLQVLVQADAQTMACTQNGRLLATGDSSGTIKLFEFDTLHLQYKIVAPGQAIKSLAFSADGLRLLDIRGNQCNVWEPPILVRGDEGDNSSISEALSLGPTVVGVDEDPEGSEITVIALHHAGDVVFCGTEDGSVSVYRTMTGTRLGVLHREENNISLRLLQWSSPSNLLASVDFSNRLVVRAVNKVSDAWVANEDILDVHIPDHTIKQMLFDQSGDHLLVSTARTDTIFHLPTVRRKGLEADFRKAWRWTNCNDTTSLALVLPDEISIHSWVDFENSSERKYSKLDTGLDGDELIKETGMLNGNGDLFVEFEHSGGNQSTAHVLLYPNASLRWKSVLVNEGGDIVLAPAPHFLCLRDRIEHVIGQFGKRFIFLDRSFWVSSIEPTTFKEDQYQRHFFVPEEWMSSNPRLLFKITSKGDFVFVKGSELAIIKKALDYRQAVSLSSVVAKSPSSPSSSRAAC